MRACNHCGSMTANTEFTCGNCGEPGFKLSLETTPTLMLCKMRDRIAQLEAENARLKAEKHSLTMQALWLQCGLGKARAALQPEDRT